MCLWFLPRLTENGQTSLSNSVTKRGLAQYWRKPHGKRPRLTENAHTSLSNSVTKRGLARLFELPLHTWREAARQLTSRPHPTSLSNIVTKPHSCRAVLHFNTFLVYGPAELFEPSPHSWREEARRLTSRPEWPPPFAAVPPCFLVLAHWDPPTPVINRGIS